MSSTNKKSRSIFAVLVVIVLLVLMAAAVTINVIFSGDKVPRVAGYYLYLHEEADMEPDIPQNSFVLAKEATTTSLSPGNKVLCYLADGNLALRVIYNMTLDSDNQTIYYPGTALEQGNELTIPRTNIFAVCLWANTQLYSFVQFATSVPGLMVCLVVPCIILIIMLLVKIARSGKDELDEDDFLFDEEELESLNRSKPTKSKAAPLFDPKQTPAADENLERKKSSISENFSEKPVNENSPYQKAVQERTMKFKKIQEEDIARAEEEARKKEEARKQAAEARKQQEKLLKQAKSAVQETTQVLSAQEIEETSRQPVLTPPPAPAPVKPAPKPAPSSGTRSSAPNLDDILDPSELRAAKNGQRVNKNIATTSSIDDLISALENEKKKL